MLSATRPSRSQTTVTGWLPSPQGPRPQRRPQATHRALRPDDYVHGIDRELTSPRYGARRRLARPPSLETIFEERKLRTRRVELNDPLQNSSLKFSASYCPRAYGVSHFPGMPFVWQQEELENFAVLTRWNAYHINITRTLSRDKLEGLRRYALGLYRNAFARGELH